MDHCQGSTQISSRKEHVPDRRSAVNNKVCLITQFYSRSCNYYLLPPQTYIHVWLAHCSAQLALQLFCHPKLCILEIWGILQANTYLKIRTCTLKLVATFTNSKIPQNRVEVLAIEKMCTTTQKKKARRTSASILKSTTIHML